MLQQPKVALLDRIARSLFHSQDLRPHSPVMRTQNPVVAREL